MKRLVLLALLCLLTACAHKTLPDATPGQEAGAAWRNMLEISGEASKEPWKTGFSLRFGTEGDTRRVTGLMWGNNERQIRLDVMAGIGAVIAMIEADGSRFTLYAPQEKKVYTHEGASPLFKIGVPVPFDLPRLALLLAGDYAGVFGSRYAAVAEEDASGVVYRLPGDDTARLALEPSGRPVAWSDRETGWSMKIGYDDRPDALPQKITLEHRDGKRAILLVKDRENNLPPFAASAMRLEAPAGTAAAPLAEYAAK